MISRFVLRVRGLLRALTLPVTLTTVWFAFLELQALTEGKIQDIEEETERQVRNRYPLYLPRTDASFEVNWLHLCVVGDRPQN